MRGTITFLTLCTALAALAQVPCKWTADLARVTPADWDCLRGETVELMPSFVSGRDVRDLSGVESATLWWQTNGMGAAYWSAPASVDTNSRPHRLVARWTPEMDCGAAAYRYFVGAAAPSGTQYRAHGTIRMRGAPGDLPNALPLPVKVIDFADVSVTNAPWALPYTAGDNIVITNGVISSTGGGGGGGGIAEETDPVWEAEKGNYAKKTEIPTKTSDLANDSGFVVDGDGDYLRHYTFAEATVMTGYDSKILRPGDLLQAGETFYVLRDDYDAPWTVPFYFVRVKEGGPFDNISNFLFGGPAGYARAELLGNAKYASVADVEALSADLGSAAYRDAGDFATAADEQLLYQLVMGSNVVFEVTNYNSRVHAPTMRLQQLDPDTREYYTVWAETNGLTRTLAAANGYTDAASNALDRAKADRAWSRHTSGLGADAPDGMTWISTPQTVIAGGYEYAKIITAAGEAWVLTSNGLGTGADTNAYFKVSAMDGEEIFSIAKTDAVLVGVDAAGITVSDSLVSVPLAVVSEAQPECYACTNLVNATWARLSDGLPSWVESAECTGASGAWVWQIETSAPRAFLQFRVLQPGGTVIRHFAPTDLSQGVLIGTRRFVPQISGSTLIWTEAAQ